MHKHLKVHLFSFFVCFCFFSIAQEDSYVLVIDKHDKNETFFETGEAISIRTNTLKLKGIITGFKRDSVFIDSIGIHDKDIVKLSQVVQIRQSTFRGTSNVISGAILLTSGILLQNSGVQREKIISIASIFGGFFLITRGIYSYFERKVFDVKKGFHFNVALINIKPMP